jgi:hypothetical protein
MGEASCQERRRKEIAMQQVGTNTYKVQAGESVTIAITAFGVIDAATVAMDAPFMSPGPPPYRFDISKASGDTHNGLIDYGFPDGAPTTAHYTTQLSGSLGGDFAGPVVFPNSLLQQAIVFEVL